jgi:hypothetical protein
VLQRQVFPAANWALFQQETHAVALTVAEQRLQVLWQGALISQAPVITFWMKPARQMQVPSLCRSALALQVRQPVDWLLLQVKQVKKQELQTGPLKKNVLLHQQVPLAWIVAFDVQVTQPLAAVELQVAHCGSHWAQTPFWSIT